MRRGMQQGVHELLASCGEPMPMVGWNIRRYFSFFIVSALLSLVMPARAALYGFESGAENWTQYSWNPGITNVQPSTVWAYAGTNSLRVDCSLINDGDKGWAGVSFDPVNLEGTTISFRVFCPTGSSGTNTQSWTWTQLRLWVKDKNYTYRETAWDAFRIPMGASTQYVYYTIHSDGTFDSTNIIQFGLQVYWRGQGTYQGPLYIDQAGFGAAYVPPEPPQTITNTEHLYDMEAAAQEAWWKWSTNPDGWHAKAWTNVYYATNEGYNGSVALAANAVFVTNNSAEVVTNELGQVTTNEYAFQKGVFEIGYQPALNLSTKDHRVLQAKLRFEPPMNQSDFVGKLYVYDKITDQWYFHVNEVGGSNWNFLEFDLDDPSQYATNLSAYPSPAGPMDASAIGFVDILVFGSSSWTGTIYVDEIVVGGRETQTNYTKMTGGFVQPAGSKFVVGGSNFYFCGANIEYLQTVSDATVTECLNWATNTHLQVVRTWAMQEGKPYSFQPERGVWNELMFEHLDRIVAEAGDRNIRLMLGLCDNWAHNGGIFQYVHWARKEHPESVNTNLNKEGVLYHDQFWTNQWCKQWYRDYVTRLLTRTNTITGVVYKDDPTIFAWEIINEPRCESDFGGARIHNWLHEMSDFVRTIDTNHMLGNGEEGGYVNTYDFADTIPWEVYPDNYYHYGTYATGSSTCDLYGCGRGHGVDFISDNKSESTWVSWQDGFYTNRGSTNVDLRAGNSNINFCTSRIYVDQKEYNVWRTNYNGADQRFEWINDHWYDAHMTIGKPMILEEFGIHAIGWIFNGSYGQVQLQRTPEYSFQDRVNIYSQYYAHIENSGISGSFFWNFGYDGMWDDPFHLCEKISPWVVETNLSGASSITLSTNYVRQGSNSLRMAWSCTGGVDQAIFRCPTNEQWVLRVDNNSTNEPPTHGINRTKFFWNFYNPSSNSLSMALVIAGGPAWIECESPAYTLTAGWTRVMFDLSEQYTWITNGLTQTNYLVNIPTSVSNVLEDVKQVSLRVLDLPAGAGELYVDNIQIKRDDGFVVYADDPVNPVIKAHADHCAARNVATNRANSVPVASNLWIAADPNGDTTPFSLAASDADGDSLSYRMKTKPTNGWVFGIPPHLVYKSKLGVREADSFSYVAYDGLRESAEAVVIVTHASSEDLRYDFETGTEGWYANAKEWIGYGVTSVVQSAAFALHADHSLEAWVDLSSASGHDAGDAEVDMLYTPPSQVMTPVNLMGQPVQISVYCPAGSRGTNTNPNRIQIYAKDTEWRTEWLGETNIVEGEWVTFTLTVATNTPNTWTDSGFTPDKIRAIGVRVKYGGAGSEYNGPIYIDNVCFPLMERRILYDFDNDTELWNEENWGSGDALLSWTNDAGNPGVGALEVTPASGSGYGKFYIKDDARIDNEVLTYRPIYRALVYVPCDAPVNVHHAVQVRLVLRSSTDGWSYSHQSDAFTLTPCQWNIVEWDMSSLPPEILADADEFGLEIVWQNRDVWSGPILIDSIQALEKAATAPPTVESVVAATNTVGRYEKFELTVGLNGIEGLNPYDPHKVDLSATFTSPTGATWKVNGFYMEEDGVTPGQGEFRIRFAPNELGAWTYQVAAANVCGTNTSAAGSFACVASDRHGWIRVSDDDAHYFESADDTPFIGKGYCHPWDGDDEDIFADAERHGVNMIHWWMAPWDTMLTVKPANPSDFWREKSSYDTYHQGRAAELDRVVGNAEKHHVKLVFTIWPHDAIRDFNYHKWRLNGSWALCNKNNSIGLTNKLSEPEWYYNAFSELDDPPKNQKFFYDDVYKEYQNRLYRYIIARWGYSDAIGVWALVSELFGTIANSSSSVNYQNPPPDVTAPGDFDGRDPFQNMATNQVDGEDHGVEWLTYINNYFKTNDPFGHPTTASYGTDEYWDGGFPVVDVPQIHTYADLYNWITPALTLKKYHGFLRGHYDKPSFMGEIGTVDWKNFEPDYLRVTAWPGLLTGGAITPMMWNTPAFSWFGDAKMGPWLNTMADEMKVLSRFTEDIPFHKLWLQQADVATFLSNEPPVQVIATFETGADGWQIFTDNSSVTGITSIAVSGEHATEGSNSLRMAVDLGEWRYVGAPKTGIEVKDVMWDWTNFWPHGTLKLDLYIPEAYDPEHNTNGFLLGINKDPRTILEVWTYDGTNYNRYSTTNEFKADGGWKKLTVGMQWNLEFHMDNIPTKYEAEHVTGIKLYFGDVGILRGPVWVDHVTAGRYAFNTVGLISSNRDLAFGWIQDRTWTNTVAGNVGATLVLNGLTAGVYNVEWWDTLTGPRSTYNASAPTGTLHVTVPDFQKDLAFKVRRVGADGTTVHDVAVTDVQEFEWVVRNPRQLVEVFVENQGTVSESFDVVLTDTTANEVVGTNTVTLAAGASVHTRFWWNCMSLPTNDYHVLSAVVSAVGGETDTADNTSSSRTLVYAQTPPWDPCSGLRRWAPDADSSDARTLTVQTNMNYVTEGSSSFKLFHRSASKEQAYFGFDQIYENWSNRTSIAFDLYVADASTSAQVLMRTGSNWVWYFSSPVSVTSGWNRNVTFYLNTNTWTRSDWIDGSNVFVENVYPSGLEEMQQLFIKVAGYADEGSVYVDNIRLDGWYTLQLGMVDGEDVFPNGVAEQSNYTGAAACWMVERYLHGDSFTQEQASIYGATTHDASHNNEITPQSAASWLIANAPSGYYFSPRARTSLTDALKETVYWMDYVPAGGLQTPVEILSGTNWSYRVIRGFQTSTKPYGALYSSFTVHGLWLKDPRLGGLGYDVYATAQEFENVYLPSTASGEYWMICEPPPGAEALSNAVEKMDRSTLILGGGDPNTELAEFLTAKFSKSTKALAGRSPQRGGGTPPAGMTNVLNAVPEALRIDEGFMAAFNSAPDVTYYEVNKNLASHYYLAAGGVHGPGSTKYVIKFAPDGSFQQATWSKAAALYPFVPVEAAVWSAQQDYSNAVVIATQLVYSASASPSPFLPAWEIVLQQGEETLTQPVGQDDSVLTRDSDGDGMTDAAELYAGVDPTNRLSGFDISSGFAVSEGTKVTITWPSLSGRTYSLYRGTDLTQKFSVVATGIPATVPMNTYTDTPPSSIAYYRVEVE